MITKNEPLFKRYENNPILIPEQWPYKINSVFNTAAVRLKDGKTLLFCRCEDMKGHSHLTKAISKDGISNWEIDEKPTFPPELDNHPEELWGVEDPRVVFIPELNKYAVTYTAYSHAGPAVSLAMTEDFITFERCGVIMPPEDKNSAMFPRKFGDQWALIHRPAGHQGSHIWISYSYDLLYWAHHKILLESRNGGWWDAFKIGLGPPPIETPDGWLMIYHGVRMTGGGCLYRLGAALFDLENPEICLLRGDNWIFGPQELYERTGDVPNVVFSCGMTVQDDGDTIYMYYGAADQCIGLAFGSVKRLLGWLKEKGRPPHETVEHY